MPPDNPIRSVLPMVTILSIVAAVHSPHFWASVVLLLVGIAASQLQMHHSWSMESDIARVVEHVKGTTEITVVVDKVDYRVVGILIHSVHAGVVKVEGKAEK